MRVPGQEDVRDVLAADLELPLILDPGALHTEWSGREPICLSESIDASRRLSSCLSACSAVMYLSSDVPAHTPPVCVRWTS